MLSQNNFQLISKYVDRVAIYMFFITLLAFLMSFDAMETSLKSVGCSGLPSGNPGLGQQGWGMPCVTSHTYFAHSCVRSSLRRQVQVPWPLMRWWRICAQCSNDRWLCLNVILFSFRMSRRSREHILWTKTKSESFDRTCFLCNSIGRHYCKLSDAHAYPLDVKKKCLDRVCQCCFSIE